MMDAPRPTSELAADVKDALESFPGAPCSCPKHKYLLDARDSVDALVARITDLEAENERLNARWQEMEHPFDKAEFDALVARVTDLEAQNATLLDNIRAEAVQTILAKKYGSAQFHRAEAAEAQVAALEARPWFPPPEWEEGWEGMVTAYNYEREYVGCIGAETWRWMRESGITEARVAALRDQAQLAADALEIKRGEVAAWKETAESAGTRVRALEERAVAAEAALARARQALTEIAALEYPRNGDWPNLIDLAERIARRALAATDTTGESSPRNSGGNPAKETEPSASS